jgi:3D (Asp-Asp-Asp) domain-containing protein
MKSIKETIIFGLIIISICMLGTIYAIVEQKPTQQEPETVIMEAPVETPVETSTSSIEPSDISKKETFISLTDSEIQNMIKTSRAADEAAREEYQALLNTGYVRPWNQPEESEISIEPIEPEEEIIEEPVITPAPAPVLKSSYNSKDEKWDDLYNFFSDWNGDISKLEYYGNKYITGYDACYSCCGKTIDDPNYGVTASQSHVKMGRTCAVNGLTFGTVLYIEGIGVRIVEDRGGMKNGNIDVYCDTHAQCYEITGTYDVYILWSPDWV